MLLELDEEQRLLEHHSVLCPTYLGEKHAPYDLSLYDVSEDWSRYTFSTISHQSVVRSL